MREKKEQIQANLHDDLWHLDTVSAVVEATKREKNVKGTTMNMFVLKTDHPKNDNEFKTFIKELKNNTDSLPDDIRMQLMVQSGEHWYPLDLEVSKGKLSAIIPEAGFSPSTMNAVALILQQFPDAAIYRFYPGQTTIDGKQRTFMIQADGESCSRFGLQQLFALQRSPNLHQQLHQAQDKLATEELAPGAKEPYKHHAFSFDNCPPEIASIFRSTQSLSALARLDQAIKEAPVNAKGESLEQYNQRFTRPNAEGKMQNLAIMDFKEKYTEKTEHFLKKLSSKSLEATTDFKTRAGINFLTDGNKYREKYTEEQEERTSKRAVKNKAARNDVWQQVNALCQEAKSALDPFKNEDQAKVLIDKLNTARIDFMSTRPDKKQSLKSAYKTQITELNLATHDITTYLRQKPDHDFATITQINTMSQILNTTIKPPERPNIVASAISSFKERLQSITKSSKSKAATDKVDEEMKEGNDKKTEFRHV